MLSLKFQRALHEYNNRPPIAEKEYFVTSLIQFQMNVKGTVGDLEKGAKILCVDIDKSNSPIFKTEGGHLIHIKPNTDTHLQNLGIVLVTKKSSDVDYKLK